MRRYPSSVQSAESALVESAASGESRRSSVKAALTGMYGSFKRGLICRLKHTEHLRCRNVLKQRDLFFQSLTKRLLYVTFISVVLKQSK